MAYQGHLQSNGHGPVASKGHGAIRQVRFEELRRADRGDFRSEAAPNGRISRLEMTWTPTHGPWWAPTMAHHGPSDGVSMRFMVGMYPTYPTFPGRTEDPQRPEDLQTPFQDLQRSTRTVISSETEAGWCC